MSDGYITVVTISDCYNCYLYATMEHCPDYPSKCKKCDYIYSDEDYEDV